MKSEFAILIPVLLQIIGLGISVSMDQYMTKRHKKIMFFIIFMVFSLIIHNVAEYLLAKRIVMPYVRTIVSVYGYCVHPLIILLFICIVCDRQRYILFKILVGINAAVYLAALFTDKISFYISDDNVFLRGP